jgi:hypothetical protein
MFFMNALDQTKTPELISKVAAVANACKSSFPRAEILLSPFNEENMGDNWADYVETSQNTIDFALKTKSGILSIFVVTKEDDMQKCDFVVFDYVSDNLRYVWEGEFDFYKKKKKELLLRCSETGNLPNYLKNKIHELCGNIFHIFDPLSK